MILKGLSDSGSPCFQRGCNESILLREGFMMKVYVADGLVVLEFIRLGQSL